MIDKGWTAVRETAGAARAAPDDLVVEVLGPLRVSVGGRPATPTAARLRALLVALVMSAGEIVSVDRLSAAVWGEDLPDNARASLHTYVNRLRAALGGDTIATVPDGYLLRAGPDNVDALRFARLLEGAAAARDGRAGSDARRERELLVEAAALWRGTPFEDVRSAWLEQAELPRLQERYLAAVERRIDLDMDTDLAADPDGYAGLIAELRLLTARYPLREPLSVRLLTVLARGGRHAEALRRYEAIRVHLAEELGVDPGPQLRAVYAELLEPGAAPAPAPGTGPAAVVPRQLPADVDGFTGREAALKLLDEVLPDRDRKVQPVVVAAIAGSAGVGKTALAVHWAHRVAGRFPDGQLHVNLRGFDQAGAPTEPAAVVRGFLDAMGVPAQGIPATAEAQAALYRSLLAGRRMLVLLDNARDAEQVRPLLPGAPGCLVLVTSRDQLPGLVAAEGARPVMLDLLSRDEARRLMAGRLGAERAATEPDALDEIIERCARLPLALAIAAARAATHPGFSLAALAAELRAELDAFATGDATTDVRDVFSWSYRTLSAPAAELFRLLALHPGADFAAPAAASLAGRPPREVRTLLAELTRAHLVSEHVPGRYLFHDLLRAYATELVESIDGDQRRRAATHRVLDHYLHTAYTAALLIYPRDPITPIPPRPGVTPQRLADHADAMAWLTAEHGVLLAAVRLAVAAGFDTHTWQLAWTLYSFFDWQGHWRDQAATQGIALAAALRLGDRPGQARTHVSLAQAQLRLRRYAEAHRNLRTALTLYADLRDRTGQARTHLNLAHLHAWEGNHQGSLNHSLRALDLHRAGRHRAGQAEALNEVGWSYALLGQHRRAIACCRQALTLLKELGHRHGQAATWDSLGYAYHHIGSRGHAAVCYRQALQLYRELGDRYRQAETLGRLGDTHRSTGDAAAAREVWREALSILDGLAHPGAAEVRAKLADLDAS